MLPPKVNQKKLPSLLKLAFLDVRGTRCPLCLLVHIRHPLTENEILSQLIIPMLHHVNNAVMKTFVNKVLNDYLF